MYKLHFSQKLPIGLGEAWEFFSSPLNLEKIIPSHLALKIKHIDNIEKKIYLGQIIEYTVKPIWNIKMEWIAEITAVKELSYFIDEQRFGPYAFWHHEHRFTEITGGVLMEDIIHYKAPFGIIGKVINHLKISKDLANIFSYRSEILQKLFGA